MGHPGTFDERPSRYRSAAYSQAGLTRVSLAQLARELADSARELVPTTADPYAAEGEFVRAAANLVEEARGLLELAVVHERCRGTGWERIADALGDDTTERDARDRYARAERELRGRMLQAWLLPERAEEIYTTPDRLAGAVADLDAWASAGGSPGEAPVSGTLPAMPVAERVAMIAEARAALDRAGSGGAEHRELEIGLCRREIELHEDLAERSPDVPEHRVALAKARERLRVLQGWSLL
ncbi:hypothetical protein [Spongiactinospora sp. TRM90649]|uniref:hypothetical protein n=1 Tax=Spongiactinospora sp. TRM90649 TaxID=3031114 RepID=UPI0023F94531|nr:hypothetical protein [Spongiactinospora sp. TRM90649]MDF5754639.1 hypothetical protein [Spongiactinospora sp. TRM90649]